jgi:hypothetical protein
VGVVKVGIGVKGGWGKGRGTTTCMGMGWVGKAVESYFIVKCTELNLKNLKSSNKVLTRGIPMKLDNIL